MTQGRVRLENIEDALRILKQIPEAYQKAGEEATDTFRTLAQGGTPVATGHAKRSWGQVKKAANNVGYSFRNRIPYMGTLEMGLYPRVGPRTVAVGGKIFSIQAPGGILQPLVDDEALLGRVAQQIVDSIMRGMG